MVQIQGAKAQIHVCSCLVSGVFLSVLVTGFSQCLSYGTCGGALCVFWSFLVWSLVCSCLFLSCLWCVHVCSGLVSGVFLLLGGSWPSSGASGDLTWSQVGVQVGPRKRIPLCIFRPRFMRSGMAVWAAPRFLGCANV